MRIKNKITALFCLILMALLPSTSSASFSAIKLSDELNSFSQSNGTHANEESDFIKDEFSVILDMFQSGGRQAIETALSEKLLVNVNSGCAMNVSVTNAGNYKKLCIFKRSIVFVPKVNSDSYQKQQIFDILIRSAIIPADNTMFASFQSSLVKNSSSAACKLDPLPTTKSAKERMAALIEFPLSFSDTEPFLSYQCVNKTECSLYSFTHKKIDEIDFFMSSIANPSKVNRSCNLSENKLSSGLTVTSIANRDNLTIIYSVDIGCIDPEKLENPAAAQKQVSQILQFKSNIEKLFCEDSEGKFPLLRAALKRTTDILYGAR